MGTSLVKGDKRRCNYFTTNFLVTEVSPAFTM